MFFQQFSLSAYKNGLGKTLLLYFLWLSLAPLIIVGFLEYNNAKKTITKNKISELSSLHTLINKEFDHYQQQIVSEFNTHEFAINLLQDIKNTISLQNTPVSEFVKTEQYKAVLSWHKNEIEYKKKNFQYTDLYIADDENNILFAINKKSIVGTKINDYVTKNLIKTINNSIQNSTISYSEQFYFSPISKKVSFFVRPLITNKKTNGFIMLVIDEQQKFTSILNQRLQNIDNVSASIVEKDNSIRFFNQKSNFKYGDKVYTKPTELWQNYLRLNYNNKNDNLFSINNANVINTSTNSNFLSKLLQITNSKEQQSLANNNHIINSGNINIMIYPNHLSQNAIGAFTHVRSFDSDFLIITEFDLEKTLEPVTNFKNQLIGVLIFTGIIVILFSIFLTYKIVMPLKTINAWVNRVASGEFIKPKIIKTNNEIGELCRSFSSMTDQLNKIKKENEEQMFLQEGLTKLVEAVRGDQEMPELCNHILNFICRYLNFDMGAIYVIENKILKMKGSYAYNHRKNISNQFKLGEGLPGQAALEKKNIIVSVPPDHFSIKSALGNSKPHYIIVIPIMYEDKATAIIELSSIMEPHPKHMQFFNNAQETIAVSIYSVQSREQVQILLDTTTEQKYALQKQQSDLKKANSELEKQTITLKESEEKLKAQSNELQKANIALKEKSKSLVNQKLQIEKINSEIEESKKAIEQKARELEEVSSYKSEFLANMSHELRTPLNSMLILSKLLADNKENNLTEDQVESAKIIDKVGHDLLNLINDILDLSKVEAGKLIINYETIYFKDLIKDVNTQFSHLAKEKEIEFNSELDANTPDLFYTDNQRLMQIIKNLISNAFKFSPKGHVNFKISKVSEKQNPLKSKASIIFTVKDDGIGISKEKHKQIFEAFRQEDGSTSRKHGGTGLGLYISKKLVNLLSGLITVDSKKGSGTTFSFYLPLHENNELSLDNNLIETQKTHPDIDQQLKKTIINSSPTNTIETDNNLVLLITSDDIIIEEFNSITKKCNYKSLIASTQNNALKLIKYYQPNSIFIHQPSLTFDIYDFIVSFKNKTEDTKAFIYLICSETFIDSNSKIKNSVSKYFVEPFNSNDIKTIFCNLNHSVEKNKSILKNKTILLVDDDYKNRFALQKALSEYNLNIIMAENGKQALDKVMENSDINLVLMDIMMPIMNGYEAMAKIRNQPHLKSVPIIALTAKAMKDDKEKCILAGANEYVTKPVNIESLINTMTKLL